MTCSEFDLIRRFFTEQSIQRADVPLGIGDDAALLTAPSGQQLVVSVDTLIAGVHFPLDSSAKAVGYKSLAVNLSDLAAMGAEPAWATLALSVPEVDTPWLADFAAGFFALASEHNVQLVGGDTTRGPLSITVQVTGFVPEGQALRRSGARPGDGVYLTGTVGDAGLGLRLLQEKTQTHGDAAAQLIHRLNYPTPRIATGMALRGRASSAIDVSDGVVADLGHVLTASGVGAEIQIDQLPLSDAYQSFATNKDWQPAVSAGDDYELCFTLPADEASTLAALECRYTCIGEITAKPGLCWRDTTGQELTVERSGFDHFATRSKP